MAENCLTTPVLGREYRPAAHTPKPRARRASTKYDQAAILRDAHARAKARVAPRDYPGPQHVLDRKIGKFVPTFTYREAFAGALKTCWFEAKQAARNAELSSAADAKITPENKAKIRELLSGSEGLPITPAGNAEYRRATTEIHALTWGRQ